MLSKQEKLKYGQQLRRQMKQKQEKKFMQKRGIRKSPTDVRIPIEPQPYFDNKQALQNRFEAQDINYYGRPGGGAPNRQNNQQNQQNLLLQQNAYEPNQMGRLKTNQQYQPPYVNQQLGRNQNFNYSQNQRIPQNQFDNIPRNIDPQLYNKQNLQNYQNFQPQNYPQQQNYNNLPFAPPSYNQNLPVNAQQPGLIQRVPTDRSFVDPYQQQIQQGGYPPPSYQDERQYQQQVAHPIQIYQQPIQQINQKHENFRQKTLQNQQLMQIHKKGGRNLLQLQNMTIDQQQVKLKQKQQMRRDLEFQIKNDQQRKKQQQERIKRQQLQQYRKNQQYIQLQKRKFQQEQRKKSDKQRQLQQQNARNLQQRRRLQQEAKQKAMREKMKNSMPNNSLSKPSSPKMKEKQIFSQQAQIKVPMDETTSQVSDSTVMDRGFNTGVSKQFFQNQRKKDQERFNRQRNLEVVTQQIKRLKQHIDKQNDFFKKQIQKVKLQSEMAQHQKQKAQQQIQNLKLQLKKKMEDDNQRLFLALQRQQSLTLENQQNNYKGARRNNQRKNMQQDYYQNQRSLKPSKDQVLVKKQYAPPPESPRKQQQQQPYSSNLGQSNVSDNGMLVSLRGQSKKIPINLPDDKLSMSRLSQFARQTQFFKGQGKSPYLGQKKASMKVQQSIVQQEEDRAQSRAAVRKPNYNNNNINAKDELDKLVETRQKSRGGNWGQLSSVNSDITKEIQQLLKKKDNPYRPPSSTKYDNPYNVYNPYISNANTNQRPSSHLSNAGKRALSRNGLQYDGVSLGTLNSNVGGTNTLGTVDIDKIHNRNDKRLNQLRNLGVQTINTNQDDQFSKLDMILQHYNKQKSRVL